MNDLQSNFIWLIVICFVLYWPVLFILRKSNRRMRSDQTLKKMALIAVAVFFIVFGVLTLFESLK